MNDSVTSTYMFPYKKDTFRLDFEVYDEYEYTCHVVGNGLAKGFMTPLLDEQERDANLDTR